MSNVLNMTAADADLVVTAGDDVEIAVIINQDGLGVDLSDYSDWLCQVKQDRSDVASLVSVTVNTTDAATGIIGLIFDGTDTEYGTLITGNEIEWSGWWDLQATSGEDLIRTFVGGSIKVVIDTSRP